MSHLQLSLVSGFMQQLTGSPFFPTLSCLPSRNKEYCSLSTSQLISQAFSSRRHRPGKV